MEGLLGQPLTIHSPQIDARRSERVIERWLTFMFLVVIGFITIVYLAAAAFSA